MEALLANYAARHGVEFVARLGEGKDGAVFQTNLRNAVKFLSDVENYTRELRAYRRISEPTLIDEIAGHRIPRFLSADDELQAISMTVVKPPFLLDFVSTYTDEEMDWFGFTEDVLIEREIFWQERFDDRWPAVVKMREEFHEMTGLTLLDLSHNNIRFE